MGGLPPFVSGVSIIRGAPVPVVDAGALLGSRERGRPTRFVTLRLGDRSVALAVEEVLGVRDATSLSLQGLPPLLARMKPRVAALIGRVDAEFLAVLRDARFVPDRAWPAPGSDRGAAWPAN
jgi:purine-binding chemotaxis protein CheW